MQTLSTLHPGRQPVLSPVRSSIEVGACSRSSMVMDLYDPSICGDLGDSCARRGSISEPQSSDQQRTECAINAPSSPCRSATLEHPITARHKLSLHTSRAVCCVSPSSSPLSKKDHFDLISRSYHPPIISNGHRSSVALSGSITQVRKQWLDTPDTNRELLPFVGPIRPVAS